MIARVSRSWSSVARGPLLDVALAAVVGALALITAGVASDDVPVGAVALILIQSLALSVRRRWPMIVYAIVGTGTVAYAWLGYPQSMAGIGVLIAIYTVAAHEPLRDAVVAGVIYVMGMTASIIGYARDENIGAEALVTEYLVNVLALILAWTVGVTMRTRRAYVAALEARNRLLEREREDNARLAVALERGRIARELHDVVAHSLSVVVVQAGAAERIVDTDAARARAAMREIAETGRGALAEMRRVLHVLRREDASDDRAPQPGIADLGELVRRMSDAGLPVELSVQGEERPLSASTGLSAYRVVQEALTNALRHAGPATARVILRYLPGAIEVQVTDNGAGGQHGDTESARADEGNGDVGHGLIGMRERIALFGGELHAGPREEGGFAVVARIPTAPET